MQLYPAVALLESTNVSVGRGSDAPFQVIGAPWLDAQRWLTVLEGSVEDNLGLSTRVFTPTSGPYRGVPLTGLALDFLDPRGPVAGAPLEPRPTLDLGLALAATLSESHGKKFHLSKVARMLRHRETLAQLSDRRRPLRPTRSHILELSDFLAERARHLHYPRCTNASAL